MKTPGQITMSPKNKQVMQQALEALEHHTQQTRPIEKTNTAINALRATLSAQPAEPADEADHLLIALNLDPETYRTDGGWLNIPKIKAAISKPADYPHISQPAEPAQPSIEIDFKQATELLEMFGGEPTSITFMTGDGHSGKGLYAHYTEIPGEGAEYLGVTDDEAMPEINAQPALAVWFGSMPESNGKTNWTAMLHRKSDAGFDSFTDGITLERSEYHDRVRYEADRVRYLIGEISEQPDILAYDGNLKSPAIKGGATP